MNDGCRQQEHLLDLIEMIYAVEDSNEVRSVFMALRQILSFSSGIFMPIDQPFEHGVYFRAAMSRAVET